MRRGEARGGGEGRERGDERGDEARLSQQILHAGSASKTKGPLVLQTSRFVDEDVVVDADLSRLLALFCIQMRAYDTSASNLSNEPVQPIVMLPR
jgi:hypothetical protein